MLKHFTYYVSVALSAALMIGCTQNPGDSEPAATKLETEDQKTLYALGLVVGRNLKSFAIQLER